LISPLLIRASIHNNTAGVFKGFYKDSETKIGKFGGNAENALVRILGEITLECPILSDNSCIVKVYNEDINNLVKSLDGEMDVTYYDPPYNEHPYGSNYHMLNTILDYVEPLDVSKVAGIPTDWQKSAYNKNKSAVESLNDLIENTKSKFILLSYNDEGVIPTEEVRAILQKYGNVTLKEKDYNTYRGSRNLKGRENKVKELLYILEK
jgi:adenine-specific DNA-methyltransferase